MDKKYSFFAFVVSALFAGCTVHHHHVHEAGPGCGCDGRASRRHKGHRMKAHGMKGHGMKGHHVKGHGMKAHHVKGHGVKGHGMKGHGGTCDRRAHARSGERGGSMPAELQSMHDRFARVWHVEPASQRPSAACKDAPNLIASAEALQNTSAPQGADADQWQETTAALVAKLGGVGEACKSKGAVDSALSDAHDSLHAVFKLVGAH